MTKTAIDYSKTVMYKIVCNNLNIKQTYVGHTTNFTSRKYHHKTHCVNTNDENHNLKVYQFIRENGGWNNWSMLQIEEFSCNNFHEATLRERYWYENLNSELNSNYPTRTKEEWREDYKEELKEKQKRYNQQNTDKMKEYNIQYRQNNGEKIRQMKKQYAQDNAVKIRDKMKQYRQDNNDIIKEKKKQYYLKNAERLREKQNLYNESKRHIITPQSV